MYRSEWFDWDMMHFLEAYLQPTDHFLDIGANTGLHTLLASTRVDPNTGGSLTCIEPDPRNLDRLRHTLTLNHLQVSLHAVAASDQHGTVSLEGSDVFTRIATPEARVTVAGVADPGPPPGTARVPPPTPLPPIVPSTENAPTTVPAVPLDHLLPPNQTFHACKIDVEGAESQVLHGAEKTIAAGRLPCLIFEHRGHGADEAALLDWLRQQGYHLGRYQHDARRLTLAPPFDDDIYAFTDVGLDLARQRLPGLTLA